MMNLANTSIVFEKNSPSPQLFLPAPKSSPICPESPVYPETSLDEREWAILYPVLSTAHCEGNIQIIAKIKEELEREIVQFANLYPSIPLQPSLEELIDLWIHKHDQSAPYDYLEQLKSRFPELENQVELFLARNENILTLVNFNYTFKEKYKEALPHAINIYHANLQQMRENPPPVMDQTSGSSLSSLQALKSAFDAAAVHFPDLKKLAVTDELRCIFARLVQVILAGEEALKHPFPASCYAFFIRELTDLPPITIPFTAPLIENLFIGDAILQLWEKCLHNWNVQGKQWQIGSAVFLSKSALSLKQFIETVVQSHQMAAYWEKQKSKEFVLDMSHQNALNQLANGEEELAGFLSDMLPAEYPLSPWIKIKTIETIAATNLPFSENAQEEFAHLFQLQANPISCCVSLPFGELDRYEACTHLQIITGDSEAAAEIDAHIVIRDFTTGEPAPTLRYQGLRFSPYASSQAMAAILKQLSPTLSLAAFEEKPIVAKSAYEAVIQSAGNIFNYATSYFSWSSSR